MTFSFFYQSLKSNEWRKNPLRWGIAAMWNLIMWNRCSSGPRSQRFRWKNPITGQHRNNQNTSFLSLAVLFSLSTYTFSLFSASLPRPLVRTFPGGCIFPSLNSSLLASSLLMFLSHVLNLIPLKQPPPHLCPPLFFCHSRYSYPAPSSLLSIISSFPSPLHLCLASVLCLSSHLDIKALTWIISCQRGSIIAN